jgi:hypothetical protein
LDLQFGLLDDDSALSATTIVTGREWVKKFTKGRGREKERVERREEDGN